jgi:hypothetical protein
MLLKSLLINNHNGPLVWKAHYYYSVTGVNAQFRTSFRWHYNLTLRANFANSQQFETLLKMLKSAHV